MERGCGDGGSLTSYTCFCTDSSSHISTIIASDVLSQCGNQTGATSLASAQATSANSVFHAYCELGVDSGLSVTNLTVPAATSATATPAASAVPEQTGATTSSLSKQSRTAAIAAGVVVPVVVIGLAATGFLVWRAQKGKHQIPRTTEIEETKTDHEMEWSVTPLADSNPVHELDAALNVVRTSVEMDGHTKGVPELGTD
ncbi:hypothetical protein BDV97DRAFT_365165 [Delphinella strobiligena]|nr:hypothetical protein BDV97DRAFT_365165 [Delphinella strobiligena]